MIVLTAFLCGFLYLAYANIEHHKAFQGLAIKSTQTIVNATNDQSKSETTTKTSLRTMTERNRHQTTTETISNSTTERSKLKPLTNATDLCTSPNCIRAASYLLESMDFEADPCEDFYQFTCGKWDSYHVRYFISFNIQ